MIIKGQKIDGRYQIIRTIGEGGMANVYLAYDTILDREVAVKILRGDLSSDEKFVKRFQREAKAASSLSHPNIVEMYDVGEENGNYFIVMEYVDGRTLKNLVKKRGALSLTETIDIMLQLTSAIATAHDSYIIHRDIKPQNVLILEDGRVKITDFGIAIALNSAELTQTNSVMGSVHYLPPEQANGSGSTVKSDIYSLGILMYELLIGKLPFKGENAVEIAIKQMKEKIPGICSQNNLIPQSIENIVLRACAKNPKNRYESVAEMHADLQTALSTERQDEKHVVYKYPENDLEETKILPNLSKIDEKQEEKKEARETREERNEELEEEVKSKKKGGVLKGTAIAAVILAILVFLGAVGTGLFLLKKSQKDTVTLPNIAGKSKEAVEEKLTSLGLIVEYEPTPSDDIAEGYVIDYVGKKKDTRIKKGSTVTVAISSGLTGVAIEDYTGKNVYVVQLELEAKGLHVILTARKVSTEVEEYENAFEGMILSQSKDAGTRLNEGGIIELVYATLITVYPDFTGNTNNNKKWTESAIQVFCEDNGIQCTFKKTESSKAPGTILSQNREPGVEVKAGVSMTIEVAIAPEPIIPEP